MMMMDEEGRGEGRGGEEIDRLPCTGEVVRPHLKHEQILSLAR